MVPEDIVEICGVRIGPRQTAPAGTRASANTSGPDFTLSLEGQLSLPTCEIANREEDSHRTKKTCFLLPDRPSGKRSFSKMTIQPFDLMSRRHPLRRQEPLFQIRFCGKQTLKQGSSDAPASKPPASFFKARLTSSSRPCGSSSQPSSLRSSPSSLS